MVAKKYLLVFVFSLGIYSALNSQTITRLDKSKISAAALDKEINRLMSAANVHGLAISIFNNNEVVYKKTFGYKNAVTKEPINLNSNIYGASLSKAVFAVLVMKLVEEGVLDLDKPLVQYLPQPIYEYKPVMKWHDNYTGLKEDTLHKKITARMCLSHTTGLPNWRWDMKDGKLSFVVPPGERYNYSGEGMVFLQVVLEKMLGKSLNQMMDEKVFKPAGMKLSSYTWQPQFEKDYIIGHNAKGQLYEKDKDNDARSASTLETTIDDYSLFLRAVLKKTILNASSTNKMFSPQVKIKSIRQVGPLRLRDTTAYDNIELSCGLGWVLLKSPYGTGAFKGGHGDGFQHYSIIFPEQGTGIVIMANSDNGESIFRELLEIAIADKYTPWQWESWPAGVAK